jgi:hypothetical protein
MSQNENRKMEQTLSHKIIKIERHRNCYGEGMKNPLLEFVLKIVNVIAPIMEELPPDEVDVEKSSEDDAEIDPEIV